MPVLINLRGSSRSMTNAGSLDVSKMDHLSGGRRREDPIGPQHTPVDGKWRENEGGVGGGHLMNFETNSKQQIT